MMVMSKKKHLQISLGDGLAHLTVIRSRNKEYLGLYIKQQKVLSSQSQGIIGKIVLQVWVYRIHKTVACASLVVLLSLRGWTPVPLSHAHVCMCAGYLNLWNKCGPCVSTQFVH